MTFHCVFEPGTDHKQYHRIYKEKEQLVFQLQHCPAGRIALGNNGTNDVNEKPETQPPPPHTEEQRIID